MFGNRGGDRPSLDTLRRQLAEDLAMAVFRQAMREERAYQRAIKLDFSRFAFLPRLISGADDEFLREYGLSVADGFRFRRIRLQFYRENLKLFRHHYRMRESQALASLRAHSIQFAVILNLRIEVWRDLARMESAGIAYLFGFPSDVTAIFETLRRRAIAVASANASMSPAML
jgi:hypothetical protein